jgi:DNA-binding Lrp family transcriptional regulator
MMKLNNTERHILGLLHFNAQTPLTEVARHLGFHYNTVTRAFDRLTERGMIKPLTRVNLRALGYKVYSVWCSLTVLGAQKLQTLIQYLQGRSNVVFAATVCGQYDLLLYFAVKDENEVNESLDALAKSVGAVFSNTSVLYSYYWYSFAKHHYFRNHNCTPHELKLYCEPSISNQYDLLDLQLIESLNDQPFASQRHLSSKLSSPLQTINYRIARLNRAKMLLGSELRLNRAALGMESWTLLIKTNLLTSELERSLLLFCRDCPNIIGCGQRAGQWNFEIQTEICNISEFQKIRFEIRRLLGSRLVGVSLITIDEELIERHKVYSNHKPMIAVAATDSELKNSRI